MEMSLKYIYINNIQDECGRVRGWFRLRGAGHQFIILSAPKVHNPVMLIIYSKMPVRHIF